MGDLDAPERSTIAGNSAPARSLQAAAVRERAVAEARSALATRPHRRRQFERLVATAQRYAAVREEIVASFTLAWPVLRHAAMRMGNELVRTGVLDTADDIFFVTREEVISRLRSDVAAPLRERVQQRRKTTCG
jgi:hypothetical protein